MERGTSPLLTAEEAAAYLNVGVSTVRHWRQKRVIPCRKLGRSVRFHVEDLNRFIEGCSEQPVRAVRRYSA